MKKRRPSKKKLEEFEEDMEDIPTKEELKKDETLFQKQLKKLRSLIRPKKVNVSATIKSSHKAKKESAKE